MLKIDISVPFSQASDIQNIVLMSYQKRRLYEKAQPQFWKYAEAKAEIVQEKWFEELLERDDYIMLTAVSDDSVTSANPYTLEFKACLEFNFRTVFSIMPDLSAGLNKF